MAKKTKTTWEWRGKVYASEKELFDAVKTRLRDDLGPPVSVRYADGDEQRKLVAKIELKLSAWPKGTGWTSY